MKKFALLAVLFVCCFGFVTGCGGVSEKGKAEKTPELDDEAQKARDAYMKGKNNPNNMD